MFGLTDDFVRLWVDCKELTSTAGMEKGQLNQRGEISSDGYFSIGQDVATGKTVVVELQGMCVSCDVEKPIRTTCEELPQYEVLPSGPEARNRGDIPINNTTHPLIPDQRGQCPVQCPRGPPGYNGTNVSLSLIHFFFILHAIVFCFLRDCQDLLVNLGHLD